MLSRICIFALSALTMLQQAVAGEVLIYDFSKSKQYKVKPAYIKTRSKARGFRYSKNEKDARLWYKSAQGRDIFSWSVKNLDIKGFDKLVLRYTASKDTYLTIDLWYDGKMVNPRLISYVKGTGKREELILPVRGKKLNMAISISETSAQGKEAPGAIREIFLKGIWGINSKPEQPKTIKTSQNIVIPQPKEETYGKKKFYLTKGLLNASFSSITVPPKTATAVLDTCIEGIQDNTGVKLGNKQLLQPNGKMVLIALDIAGKSDAAKSLKVKIPQKPEAYVIKCGKYKGKNTIVVAGRDIPGLFWGLQTLLHLVKKDATGVFVPECHIKDWPGYPYRSMGGGSIKSIKCNLAAKINVHFTPAWDPKIKGKWNNPPESYRSKITEMIKYCQPRGVQINQWVEPYDRASKNNITCSDPNQVDAFYNTFKLGLELGNRVITIGFDDQARVKDSLQPKDRAKFGSDVKTHAWLVAEIAKRVNKDYPGTTVCSIPKTYQSGTGVDIKGYYDRAGVPKNIVIMWTGESTVTLSYPEYKVKTFENCIEGRRFVIFDNTFCQTLGEGRSLTLFETFGGGYKSLAKSNKCLGFHAMAGFSRSEMRKIKAYEIADFLWNPKRHNPEASRSRAMAKVAGARAVAPLLKYRYYMMKIAELFPVEKPVKKLKKAFIKRSGISDNELKNYLAILAKADSALVDVDQNTTNKKLVSQLKNLLGNARKVLKKLNRQKKNLKVVTPTGTIDFDIAKDIRGGRFFKLYSHECSPKPGMAVYGNKAGGKNRMALEFILKKQPAGNAQLIIEGQDDDKAGTTLIQISLNDNVIFKGKNPFVEKGWSTKTFTLPKELLQKGVNQLTIRNLEKSDSFASQWFMVSKLELKF